MNENTNIKDPGWWRPRLRRHVGEIMRLAWPAIIARLGIMTLALVDTVMVARYATVELAYLQIGSGTTIMKYDRLSVRTEIVWASVSIQGKSSTHWSLT